jgi:hypothetical protein
MKKYLTEKSIQKGKELTPKTSPFKCRKCGGTESQISSGGRRCIPCRLKSRRTHYIKTMVNKEGVNEDRPLHWKVNFELYFRERLEYVNTYEPIWGGFDDD